MPEIIIRPYKGSDQAAVFQIASDTAFYGEPVEAFLEDRDLFCDTFVGFYTSQKARFCWVADNGDKVIGYLLGSPDIIYQSPQWRSYVTSRVLMSFFKGCYRIGRRTARYSFGSLLGFLRGEEPPVDLAIYPAHLHINIDQNFRGGGVGRRLISTYLEQLRGIGVNGVYLHTTSHNETACHLYGKLGFQLLSSRPNRYWSRWFGYTVENRSYGLKLL